MVLDDKGKPQPTGEFETLEADSPGAGAGPGRRPVAARRRAGAWSERRRGAGRPPDPDDRPPGPVRRRRHGAGRAQRHGGRGPRQEGGAPHRRLAARHAAARGHRKHAPGHLRAPEHLVLQRRTQDPAPAAGPGPAHQQLRRGAGRPDRGQRAVRGAPLPELRQLLRVRQLLRRVPRQRGHQARVPGKRFQFNYDYCKGCGLCAAECPCGAIDMVPELV
jgi:hypothetical protein